MDSAGDSEDAVSSAVEAAVQTVDEALLGLLAGLEDRDLVDEVDLITVANHGRA